MVLGIAILARKLKMRNWRRKNDKS
jgi:hypothetical protein